MKNKKNCFSHDIINNRAFDRTAESINFSIFKFGPLKRRMAFKEFKRNDNQLPIIGEQTVYPLSKRTLQ